MSDLLAYQTLRPFPIATESNLLKLLKKERPNKENNKQSDIINNFDSNFSHYNICYNIKKQKQSILKKYINSTKNVLNSNDENKTKNEIIEPKKDFPKMNDLIMSKLILDGNDGKAKSKFDFANIICDDDNEINEKNGNFKNKTDYSNSLENDTTQNSYNCNILINEEMNNINQGSNCLIGNNISSSKFGKNTLNNYCNGNELKFIQNNYNNQSYYNNNFGNIFINNINLQNMYINNNNINQNNNINFLVNNFNYINSFPFINNSNINYNTNINPYQNYNFTSFNDNNINFNSINNKSINNIKIFNPIIEKETNNSYLCYHKIKNDNFNRNDLGIKEKFNTQQLEHNIEQTILLLNLENNKIKLSKEQKELKEKTKSEIFLASKDISGNYSIQKIIKDKNLSKINLIIDSIKTKIFELTLHLYGCRVIQEIILVLNAKDLDFIITELKPFYNECIEDKNGNHVIQRLIEKFTPEQNNDIFAKVIKNIIKLSKHQYGCRVIQRLFKYCSNEQIKIMLKEIYSHINELILDQYGNYVVQFIIENNKEKDNLNEIYQSISGHIYNYSIHKFASNVIEVALNKGNEKQRKDIINEILLLDEEKKGIIISMAQDKFGNYVIQKIIEYSEPLIKQKIISKILKDKNILKTEGFSRHVINYIQKFNVCN